MSPTPAPPPAPQAPAPQPLARCREVSRTYGKGPNAVVAVHGARCDVWPGDRIAVAGASGSGKSTLLHLLAGLEPPTTGEVTWPGLDRSPTLNGSPALDPGVGGVVFQGPSLIPALDVTENVALPLVLAGVEESAATARAVEALTRLGVDDLGAKLPEELSGGQAQRVAVARVLAARPRLILADEPTGQLDHTTAAQVVDVLVAAADELGAALVITTHDPVIADRMARHWPMRSGRLTADEQALTEQALTERALTEQALAERASDQRTRA
jgi:putative ABC transport system ATP-binding protein